MFGVESSKSDGLIVEMRIDLTASFTALVRHLLHFLIRILYDLIGIPRLYGPNALYRTHDSIHAALARC
jgi:hypothetical protein